MMKICNKCGEEKPEEEFSWRYQNVERLQSCKDCHSEYTRQWYIKNKERQKRSVRKNNKKYRKRNKDAFFGWLSKQKCLVCGNDDMIVLEMHHRHPREKEINITMAINRSFSLKKLLAEVDKCDVLCANCHKRKHYRINEEGHRTNIMPVKH